jgi:hypothetical protein
MKSLIIPIHSFVDLITNSSSEIFVAADKSTITAIKKLVDNLFIAAKSPYTANQLFDFELVYLCTDADYNEHWLTADEIKAKKAEIEGKPEEDDWSFKDEDGDGYVKCNVRVQLKESTGDLNQDKAAKDAAKVLSDLTGLFEIEATYD